MARNLHREVWQSLGEDDPDWAVLSEPGKKHGGWATDLERFYATGQMDVAEVLRRLPTFPRNRAIDWGSGTGRLSLALAQQFELVTCLDVSNSMLAQLTSRAQQRGITNIEPVHLDDFRPAGDHDLCLSLLVLQHLPDKSAMAETIALMVASLRVGGFAFVEIPAEGLTFRTLIEPRFRAYRFLRRLGVKPDWLHRHGLSGISMQSASEGWTRSAFQSAGAEVEAVIESGGSGNYRNLRYFARRTQ
jgi:SAM-dependent methyltransferase